MTTPPPDKQPAAETPENTTQPCGDCGGTGKSEAYCGCSNLTRRCSYCSGTGRVLTSAAREERRRKTELRYTQADMDSALRNERERCAKVADRWANARSCATHDDDPCCHVRTGARIAEVIREGK